MGITKVEAYKAADGSLFESVQGAESHNKKLARDELHKKIDAVIEETLDGFNTDLRGCEQFIQELREELTKKFIIEER